MPGRRTKREKEREEQMDQTERIRRVSNSFYNEGLRRAQRRDLTGAVQYLKKCLNLNKYHIDARNLLGLIYYEMGEVSEALVQWVISMNLKDRDNRADFYLEQIQRKQERLEQVSQVIRRYNQALFQAKSGSDDLAVLQLTRVVEANPRFVKAHLLLALLYITHEDYTKAGKSLYKVLKIDKNNPTASWYMAIVKARTGKAEIERRKIKNAFSHRQMQDDDVIIPPSYKENTGLQSVLNIGAGLLLGAAVIFLLVMPAKLKEVNNAHTQELLQYNEQLNQKNEEISSLNNRMAEYENTANEAQSQLDSLLNSSDNAAGQYAILVRMMDAYENDNLTEAVTLYAGFDASLLTDPQVQQIAASLSQEIETNGYQALEDLAYTMWSAGRMSEALTYYQTCLQIKPDSPNVIYNMGMIYRSQGETDRAVELFTQVVTQYADSEQAPRAREQLAQLVPENQQAAVPGQSILSQSESEAQESASGQAGQENPAGQNPQDEEAGQDTQEGGDGQDAQSRPEAGAVTGGEEDGIEAGQTDTDAAGTQEAPAADGA